MSASAVVGGSASTVVGFGVVWTSAVKQTRISADSHKPRDAFRGWSRSPNVVPFHMLDMVSH